jgi:DNA invertase Pin-like site-specific DNA recombinase
MPQRAYPYARFSCGKQKRGDSARRQGEWYAAACAKYRWVLDDTEKFFDEARSAFRGKNSDVGDLGRFLSMVKRGRITAGSVLLVESLDRLTREEVGEALELVRGILKGGITIATREPERVYKPGTENDLFTIFEWLCIAARAHEESATKSMRVTKAWETARQKARAGERLTPKGKAINPSPPSWVRKTATGYELHPERAAVIRGAVRLAMEGRGFQTICGYFAAAGVKSPGRSGRWSPSFVRQVLRGRNLIGEWQPARGRGGNRPPCGPPVKLYPALLSEGEWDELQLAITGRRSKRPGRPARERVNLFTGLVKDTAGNRLALHTCVRGDCSWRHLSIRGRGVARVRYEDFEGAALDALAMLRPADVLEPSDRQDEREHRIAALTDRQTRLIHRQEQLIALAADPEEDLTINREVLRRVTEELVGVSTELQALKLESKTGRAEALTEVQTLWQLVAEAEGEERNELDRRIKAALPSVVSEIRVQCQRISERTQIVHVGIYLRSGTCRYVRLMPENLRGVRPWNLDKYDLRRGPFEPEVANGAAVAETA